MLCAQNIYTLFDKHPLFCFSALCGTVLFGFQLLFTLLGLIDFEAAERLSKHALTGFLMLFGWTGLGCTEELHFSALVSTMIAFGLGILSIIVIGYIFKWAKILKNPGNVFQIEELIGRQATVYHRIAVKNPGKITLSLNEITYEVDAISNNEEEIPSFTEVLIIKKIDQNTVLVIPR